MQLLGDKGYHKKLGEFFQPLLLPVCFALLFSLQNYVFNSWLNLSPLPYLGRFFAVTFGLGLALYGPAVFFGKRSKYLYFLLIASVVSLLFVLQFGFFRYSQSFLQVSAVKYFWQAASVKGTATTLLSWQLAFFFINIGLVATVWFIDSRRFQLPVSISRKRKLALLFFIFLVSFSGYYILIRQEKKEWGNSSRLYTNVYDLNTLVKKVGIINFTLEDAVKYFARANLVNAADEQFLQQFHVASTEPQKPVNFGIAKGRNIIFIQVESLERATLNTFVEGQEITPNLDALAKQGLYFSNYYTQIGPGNTADAEFSTLDSLYPLQDDVVFANYAQNNFDALPKVLSQQGYTTHALNGDVKTFWNRANIYPRLGYQQQISEDQYVKSRPIGKGPTSLGDSDFLSQSLPKLETFKAPFFADLITESSHTPFELPEDLQTLQFTNSPNLNYTQQQYLESVHYADQSIGDFIAQLKKTDLYDNSVIAIYGDHGSFTGISEALGKENPAEALRNSEVPLILLVPGTNLQGKITTPGSHLDLFPTIANLVGIEPPKTVLGQDMLNTKTPVLVHRSIFSGTINAILTDRIIYEASDDGVYEHGQCLQAISRTPLSIEECRAVYNQQSDIVKASDIAIRGNLINTIK